MRTTLIALAVALLASTAQTADRNKLPSCLLATGASTMPEMTKRPRHTGWVDVCPTKGIAATVG